MLLKLLPDKYQRELVDIHSSAENILSQPIDFRFTDHTIAHKDRILEHLDNLLDSWANTELERNERRTQAEIFILIAATYLHDIGMQFTHFERCPNIVDKLIDSGMKRPVNSQITEGMLEFARKHHHIITYDWITNANLPEGRDLFPRTGLKTHVEAVARVARAHNIWLTNNCSYRNYEHLVANLQEQDGEIRVSLLAAFLRMGDIVDMDGRRVDIDKLKRYDIPNESKAHWWRHHFTTTCRLDDKKDAGSIPLRLSFTLPRSHESDLDWLVPALYSATVKEIDAEQHRLSKYLGGAGVWIEFPEINQCDIRTDVSGQICAMPDPVKLAFKRFWPVAEGELVQLQVSSALKEGSLTTEVLDHALRPMEIRAEIEEYLAAVKKQEENGFRNTPYTPIELDYGDFDDALDALGELLDQPQSVTRPIVIVGDPGAGKTTLMRRYILDCAKSQRSPQFLPIYIMANRYGDAEWAKEMHSHLGNPQTPISEKEYQNVLYELSEHLFLLIAETVCDLVAVSYKHVQEIKVLMREIMARRSCLIVLDGINEAPPLLRALAIPAVRTFVEEYPAHRVLITSRIGDYHEDFFPTAQIHSVLPLKLEAIEQYWEKLGIAASNRRRVLNREEMSELATNPMYMYMMGELMGSNDLEHLQHPGKLFRRFTQETLRRWHRGNGQPLLTPDDIHEALAQIAFTALEKQEVAFNESTLVKALENWLKGLDKDTRKDISITLSKYCMEDEGIFSDNNVIRPIQSELVGVGLIIRVGSDTPPRYRFRHHTTQDYFAAWYISKQTELLPTLVSKAVFHEPIRLVVSLIDDPNGFVQKLTASTTKDIGRNSMLRLCFRVAGAMSNQLSQETLRDLFAAVIPIYYITITLRLPFGVELLSHLFSHLSWEVLGRSFAIVAESKRFAPYFSEHAQQQVVKALTQNGRPTEQTLRNYFDNEIPDWKWEDYHNCQQILLYEDEGKTGLSMHPLLLGGTSGSPSLTALEKIRVATALRRITANQMGQLEGATLT